MATKKNASKSKKAPWKKPAPKKTRPTKLTAAQKASARHSAKIAKRPYPNLIDNMRAAKKKK